MKAPAKGDQLAAFYEAASAVARCWEELGTALLFSAEERRARDERPIAEMRQDMEHAVYGLARAFVRGVPTPRPGGVSRDPRDCERIDALEMEVARLRACLPAEVA